MRVLIVDDSKVARFQILRSFPDDIVPVSNVDFAINGQDGVDKYKKEKYDLIFMDLTVSVKNGYEAAKDILEYDKDAQIIIVTADIQKNAKEKILNIGAKLVIEKPVSKQDIDGIFYKGNLKKEIRDENINNR